MDITFFGTGSAFSTDLGNNAALLEFNGTNLLLDCGHTVPSYLEKHLKGGVGAVENIWISHMHGDHIGGLEEIAFRNKFVNNGKMATIYVHADMYHELLDYLACTLTYGDDYNYFPDDYFNFSRIYAIKEEFEINGEKFFVKKTNHLRTMNSYMLSGSNFIFTGDTKFIDWTQYDLNGIDYIFHDTQLMKYGKDVHATLPDMKKLPAEIRNKIYCMHYGININDYAEELWENKFHIVKNFEKVKLK